MTWVFFNAQGFHESTFVTILERRIIEKTTSFQLIFSKNLISILQFQSTTHLSDNFELWVGETSNTTESSSQRISCILRYVLVVNMDLIGESKKDLKLLQFWEQTSLWLSKTNSPENYDNSSNARNWWKKWACCCLVNENLLWE